MSIATANAKNDMLCCETVFIMSGFVPYINAKSPATIVTKKIIDFKIDLKRSSFEPNNLKPFLMFPQIPYKEGKNNELRNSILFL